MADKILIAQPPTRVQQALDLLFRKLCWTFAFLSALFVVVIVVKIATAAAPAMKQYGL